MGASTTNNGAFMVSESDREVLHMWQQDDEITCVVVDEQTTMEAMKVISSAVLTMIAALSSYSAEKVAPLAHRKLAQEFLLISPYICIPVALSGVIFSFCASKSNGLAECATAAVLSVCLFGIVLGASSASIMLHVAHRSAPLLIGALMITLMIALICTWGWLFNNPRLLKVYVRRLYWECFDRRRSTDPWRAAYSDPRSNQHTEQNGFCKILSHCIAACQRAFLPLDEDTTISILKTVSPSALTAISVLSLWAARTVGPQAYYSATLQMFFYILPYVYVPLGVLAIVLAVSASKSNGLASYASSLGLCLCLCGVVLGTCCGIVVLHLRPLVPSLVAVVVAFTVICAWGWMLAYPKLLNFTVRKTYCLYCARRLRIVPLGRIGCCGRNFRAWLFVLVKILCHNMVFFPSHLFAVCLRWAQGWRLVDVHKVMKLTI